jgi:hypothetical protein
MNDPHSDIQALCDALAIAIATSCSVLEDWPPAWVEPINARLNRLPGHEENVVTVQRAIEIMHRNRLTY